LFTCFFTRLWEFIDSFGGFVDVFDFDFFFCAHQLHYYVSDCFFFRLFMEIRISGFEEYYEGNGMKGMEWLLAFGPWFG
jgi:hypothetical protein